MLEVERELCRRHFVDFVRLAWPILEPAQPYVHNWHIDMVAEHLEAVTRGEITRLLVNIPPGTMKSMLVGVLWPAWEWGPCKRPALRYVTASHAEKYAHRDSGKMRDLVLSEWYRERWPHVEVRPDKNSNERFVTTRTGFRHAMPMVSLTGSRGDRVIIDDPHNVEGALSKADRERDLRIAKETVPTRVNNPDRSAIIYVMQRLHEEDISGMLLSEKHGYVHLMLPMEFEPNRRCVTQWGADPRTQAGELLFPQRFPRWVVERDKTIMGEHATAGQFQQRPAPRGGALIKADRLQIDAPGRIVRSVRYWDKAGTAGGGAYTAGVLVGVDAEGGYWVLDVVRGQWSAKEREKHIRLTAEADGTNVPVWIEQEPGSGGKESAENTVVNLAGYVIKAERVTGDKVTRAEPFSIQVENGNVKLRRAAWNADYLAEARTFPLGKYKDQIDATSGAFNKLAQRREVRFV